MILKQGAAHSVFRNSFGFDLHGHLANRSEQWQFETAHYSPKLLPFLTIGQDTLPQPNARLALYNRANRSIGAKVPQPKDFLKTLHQLGLVHLPIQTLVDWICGVP